MKKEKAMPESKETPMDEAKYHSKKFLKKAVSLAHGSGTKKVKKTTKTTKRKTVTKKA